MEGRPDYALDFCGYLMVAVFLLPGVTLAFSGDWPHGVSAVVVIVLGWATLLWRWSRGR